MKRAKARRVLTGVDIGAQIPLLEKVGPHWLLWIEYDVTHNTGTYLRLLGDGQVWLERRDHSGECRVKNIKPKESHS